MSNLPPIKISHELIMASGIMLVGLIALASLIMTMTLSSSTQNAIVYLYNLINNSHNDTFQLETNGHLAYLQQSILGVSQTCNITHQADIQTINTLKESNKNLQTLIFTMNKTIDNLTIYIMKLNDTYQGIGMRTADNITEYSLNDTWVPQVNVTQVQSHASRLCLTNTSSALPSTSYIVASSGHTGSPTSAAHATAKPAFHL